MRYDVYIDEVSGKAEIYNRGDVQECGLKPDGKPVFVCEASDCAWSEWLDANTDWRDDNARRILRRRISTPARFVKDLEKMAQSYMDDWRESGRTCGWGEVHIDTRYTMHTYRASADWKNEPTRYTFDQMLKWDNPPKDYHDFEALSIRDSYVRLIGIADAVRELGMMLVFDSDFKVRIMGSSAEWHAVED